MPATNLPASTAGASLAPQSTPSVALGRLNTIPSVMVEGPDPLLKLAELSAQLLGGIVVQPRLPSVHRDAQRPHMLQADVAAPEYTRGSEC